MNKLELLLKKCPDKVNLMVEKLYKENFTKKKKTIYHFKVLGKVYDSDIFTNNYINFLKDVSKIHQYRFFELGITKCFISPTYEGFRELHYKKNCVYKITEHFYVSTYSSTEKKLGHIQNICELLGVKFEKLN